MLEFLESVKNFVYSPAMIGVQVFVVLLSFGLAFLLARIVKDLGGVHRWVEEKRVSLKQGADQDDMQSQSTAGAQQPTDQDNAFFQEQWNTVVKRMSTSEQEQWKLAIIEADALLDRAIQRTGVQGTTMGERMKNLNPQSFPLLDSAWKAHRVRNYIAHDPSYIIDITTASRVFEMYRRIFVQLGVVVSEGIAQPVQ